jgi:hypothetical protein
VTRLVVIKEIRPVFFEAVIALHPLFKAMMRFMLRYDSDV